MMPLEGGEEISDLRVLMRVLDIIERRIEYRNLQNNENVQVTHIANHFMSGAVVGTLIEGSIRDGEIIMGDKFEAHGHAQVGNMGNEAQIGTISFGDPSAALENIDFAALVPELRLLRVEMRRLAATTEEDEAVVAIGQALAAAEKEDSSSLSHHLKSAGQWAFALASSIGGGVALAAIKSALGL